MLVSCGSGHETRERSAGRRSGTELVHLAGWLLGGPCGRQQSALFFFNFQQWSTGSAFELPTCTCRLHFLLPYHCTMCTFSNLRKLNLNASNNVYLHRKSNLQKFHIKIKFEQFYKVKFL
jgi:hypothetical protein